MTHALIRRFALLCAAWALSAGCSGDPSASSPPERDTGGRPVLPDSGPERPDPDAASDVPVRPGTDAEGDAPSRPDVAEPADVQDTTSDAAPADSGDTGPDDIGVADLPDDAAPGDTGDADDSGAVEAGTDTSPSDAADAADDDAAPDTADAADAASDPVAVDVPPELDAAPVYTPLDPLVAVPPEENEPCSSLGSLRECEGIAVCRPFAVEEGRCESCDACGNLDAPCSASSDCDILFTCYAGRCTNICPLGTYFCGPIEDCLDIGHAETGVCRPW